MACLRSTRRSEPSQLQCEPPVRVKYSLRSLRRLVLGTLLNGAVCSAAHPDTDAVLDQQGAGRGVTISGVRGGLRFAPKALAVFNPLGSKAPGSLDVRNTIDRQKQVASFLLPADETDAHLRSTDSASWCAPTKRKF
jgi:hypothetical protein